MSPADIWSVGVMVSAGIGMATGVILWLRIDSDDIVGTAIDTIGGGLIVGMLVGIVLPASPIALPAYGLWRLKLRMHPRLRLPDEDLRATPSKVER